MEDLTLEQVKQFIKDNQNDENVQNYIQGFVTQDRVKAFLETDEGKKLLQPKLDQYFNKGLETWKQNNLDRIVNEKIQEKHPEETDEQKRIKQLEQTLTQEQKARKRREVENKAIKQLTDKDYPVELVDFISAEDDDELNAKLQTLDTVLDSWAKKLVDKQYQQAGRAPRKPDGADDKNTKNPWSKENWNLTEQGRMMKENPELAKYFKENTRR